MTYPSYLSTTETYLANLLYMRQYQPIWEQIKRAGTATLIAPIDSHRRIIQAVRKEKCKDSGWRLLCSEKGIKYELADSVEIHVGADTGAITFKIVDVSGISINDL